MFLFMGRFAATNKKSHVLYWIVSSHMTLYDLEGHYSYSKKAGPTPAELD